MITKFGNATLNSQGYYRITTRKEGNNGKLLHVLIWEDHYGISVPFNYVIHHINHNSLNNNVWNLQCVEKRVHARYHLDKRDMSKYQKIGIIHTDKTKKQISKNLSKRNNTVGYYNVSKQNRKKYKQGFIYRYHYIKDGKTQAIYSIDINKLEQKVKNKGLEWIKFEE